MDAGRVTGSRAIEGSTFAPDDEVDETASVVAGLSEYPKVRSAARVCSHAYQSLAIQEEPDMPLIKAQLDLLRYLLTKAQTANDRLLSAHSTSESLRSDAEKLRAVFELIVRVEHDDYMCLPEDQEEIQSWMHSLVSSYAGGSETDERIARVIAVEKSMGLGDAGDEIWGT